MKKVFALLLALVMVFSLAACGGSATGNETPTQEKNDTQTEMPTQQTQPSGDGVQTPESPDSTTPSDNAAQTDLVDGMRPNFKAAMDSYEAFFNQYCECMRAYQNNPSDAAILAQYTELMGKLSDMEAKMDA